MSFSDNGVEFKLYLNEEIERIKQSLKQSMKKEEISKDHTLKEKTDIVLKKVEKYGQKDIDTFVSLGADANHCWLSKLGVLHGVV